MKAIDHYENGLEDGLANLPLQPDPLFYDDYMAGYSDGQALYKDPVVMASYQVGYLDGINDGEPSTDEIHYMRGYGDGQLANLAKQENEFYNEYS